MRGNIRIINISGNSLFFDIIARGNKGKLFKRLLEEELNTFSELIFRFFYHKILYDLRYFLDVKRKKCVIAARIFVEREYILRERNFA